MANGIGSLLEKYGNPQTKKELAGSTLAAVSPAGGLLDAITSMLALKEGQYGKAALYALGASLPFVSGSPLSKLAERIINRVSKPGTVKPRLTGRDVDQLFELDATPEQVGKLDRHIRFMNKYSTMGRRGSAKRRSDAPMKDTPRRIRRRERGLPEDSTPRVGGGQGWLDVGKKKTAEEIDPATARARQRLKEDDEALLSLDDQ